MEVIYIIGSAQAVFFAILLVTKKKPAILANRILALWLLIISFNLAFMYATGSGIIARTVDSTGVYFLGFVQQYV